MTYRLAAKFYDLFGSKNDLKFYRELALQCEDKALELGVGPGRVAIHLAKAGIMVVGIDNSVHMLRVARGKLARETAAVKRCIVLKRGDMRNFELTQKFPFIYIPASTFDHNTTVEQQKQTLNCINRHLETNGTLAFDLEQVPPDKPETSWWIDQNQIDEERLVVRSIFTRINRKKRTGSLNLFFDLYRNGKLQERYHEHGEVALISKSEGAKLLEETNFNVERIYGDFNKEEYTTNSPRIIFVARRKQ